VALVVAGAVVFAQPAGAAPLTVGNVLAGTGNGRIKEFTPTGTLVQTLDTGTGSFEDTGMCFRANGNLLTTNFEANNMSEFDGATGALIGPFGSGFNQDPESCAVDSAGNIYVGQADGSGDILKFSATGTLLANYNAATDRGTDWIDLAADQQTIFYASEGNTIRRFNVATNTQLADFATVPSSPCYALRIRPNGEVMVACTSAVYRLSPTGTLLQTYTLPGGNQLFALNLDPDNTTFWTANIDSVGQIWRVDIDTGAIVTTFLPSPEVDVAGLAVVGEIRVAQQPPTCMLTSTTDGPPKQIQITVQASGGLQSVTVDDSTNAVTPVPSFTPGTTDPVVITSTKVNQGAGAHVALTVTARSGGSTVCDPVLPGTKPHLRSATVVSHAWSLIGRML
jgi:streptogramin lyase